MPLLLNSPDTARMLAVSEKTLWNNTAPRGPIVPVRIGKSVRYSVAAIEKYIADQIAKQATT